MSDIVSPLITSNTSNTTLFSKTLIGKCFADCIEGKVNNYGCWCANNNEQLRTMKELYEDRTTVWNIPFSSTPSGYFEGAGELSEFFTNGEIKQDNMVRRMNVTRKESSTLDVCMFMCKNIGTTILTSINEYIKIVCKRDTAPQYYIINLDNLRHYSKTCQLDKFKQLILCHKPFNTNTFPGSHIINMLPSGTQFNNMIVDKQNHVTLTSVQLEGFCNYVEKVMHYLVAWWEVAIAEFEAKRAELYSINSSDNYDEQLSNKTMLALEEEAASCGVEVSQLPQYTIDSIALAVRRDNPRKTPCENVHLITMQQLTPYVEASCAGLIAKAKQFASEYSV